MLKDGFNADRAGQATVLSLFCCRKTPQYIFLPCSVTAKRRQSTLTSGVHPKRRVPLSLTPSTPVVGVQPTAADSILSSFGQYTCGVLGVLNEIRCNRYAQEGRWALPRVRRLKYRGRALGPVGEGQRPNEQFKVVMHHSSPSETTIEESYRTIFR